MVIIIVFTAMAHYLLQEKTKQTVEVGDYMPSSTPPMNQPCKLATITVIIIIIVTVVYHQFHDDSYKFISNMQLFIHSPLAGKDHAVHACRTLNMFIDSHMASSSS